jgi:hypothetical protein
MSISCAGLFDIETEDWEHFVLGGAYCPELGFQSWSEESDFFNFIITRVGEWWAWNGGLYDFLWFLEQCRKRGIKARVNCAGTRITRIQVDRLVLRDACALIPMSLFDAADIAGLSITKDTGLVCDCGSDCGGYCRIRREGMTYDELRSLETYLEIDCVTGYRIIDSLLSHAEKENYVLTGTVGGSAWRSAQTMLDLPKAEWRKSAHYRWARAGYYGGRVQVFKPYSQAGYRFDVNSAYPAALAKVQLPLGPYLIHCGDKAGKFYRSGKEGIYNAIVRVPKMLIPPLPWKSPTGRLCYPIGQFRGSWTGLELRYAESVGVKIVKVNRSIVWLESEVALKPFVENVFEVRSRYGKKTGIGKWQKWFGNSLTGKFAQRPEGERVVMHPAHDDVRFCPAKNCTGCGRDCCSHRCTKRCKRWSMLDREGLIWSAPYYQIADCAHVEWAAHLTAHQRIVWHTAALSVEKGLVYGDTDSIFTEYPLVASAGVPLGSELGAWGSDGAYSYFLALGPKMYRFRDEKDKEVCRAKGLSGLTPDMFEAFQQGRTVSVSKGVMGFKSAAKRGDGLFRKKHITRTRLTASTYYGDRKRRGDATYPMTVADLRKLV